MKSNKGITLVALVVTIIVLIILAGISINLTLGDNGIITIAKQAKENMEIAKVEEERELNELYTQLEAEGLTPGDLPYDSIVKLTEFKTAIANAIGEAGGVKPDISADATIFANNIKGIVKEVTKDATATADNITKGKTAWVNGELIVGNGNDNATHEEQGIIDGIKNFYQKDSSIIESVQGDSIGAYVFYNGTAWANATDSYNFDSGLIPIFKQINGKKAALISIQFSVSHSNTNSSYGGERSSSSSSYRLEFEDGTEITSGETCSNLYINLLNYELNNNNNIRLTSSGAGYCQIGTNTSASASFSAGITDISVTYKIFEK